MRRSLSIGVAVFVAAATAVVAPGNAGSVREARAATPTRPNILVIVTDDQRADGGWEAAMPKTAALFKQQGLTFTNFFGTTPLCCPDRATFLSGRYAHNNGLRTNGDPAGVAAWDQAATVEGYLHAAGYHTGMAGKFLHPWEPLGRNPLAFDRWALTASAYQDGYFNLNGSVRRILGYNTDAIGSVALADLQAWEATDATPWFLYLAPKGPHAPWTAQPRYATATFPWWAGNPAVAEANVSDKPPGVRWRSPGTLAQGQALRTTQFRTLRSVDDMVGTIFDRLTALGEANDTLAVFMSDNGFLWGEHRIFADKRFPYTQSVKIPFLVRWPGHVVAGSRDWRLAGGIDLLPTFLSVAGVTPTLTYPLDGRSLFSTSRRSRILLEYFHSPDSPLASWASDRTATSQYVEWYTADGAVLFREYYDLTADPWQLTNLLADGNPANDPDVGALSAQLKADRSCVGASCP